MAVNICTGGIGNLMVDGLLVGGLGVSTAGVLKSSGTTTTETGDLSVICNQSGCQDGGGGSGGKFQPPRSPRGRYSWRELFSR